MRHHHIGGSVHRGCQQPTLCRIGRYRPNRIAGLGLLTDEGNDLIRRECRHVQPFGEQAAQFGQDGSAAYQTVLYQHQAQDIGAQLEIKR